MKNAGFTLLELLIVITIAAILVGIAIPSFDGYIKKNAVEALEHELNTSINLARGEALTRQRPVSIACIDTSSGGINTTVACGGDWSGGWVVFVDDSSSSFANGLLDASEEVLFAKKYKGNARVAVSDPDNNDAGLSAITLNFRGALHDDSRAFALFCSSSDEAIFARGLLLERSGRLMRSRDSDNDGIHNKKFASMNTSNLACSA